MWWNFYPHRPHSNYIKWKVTNQISPASSLDYFYNLPEVADLDDGPRRGPVPGVLVDQQEHDLLQPDGDLTQHGAHMLRQLE